MKRIICLLLPIILLCSGCASSIEKSAHPVVLALDRDGENVTETGLYCMQDGESVRYALLSTSGLSQGQARAEKEGYSYSLLNYSLLSTVVVGEGLLKQDIFAGLEMLLGERLPDGSILLCATVQPASEVLSKGDSMQAASSVPLLPESAGNNNLMPKCSLAQLRIAAKDGCPVMLPLLTYDTEYRLRGAVLCGQRLYSVLDSKQTAIWCVLHNEQASGIMYLDSGAAFSCKIKRALRLDGTDAYISLTVSASPLCLNGQNAHDAALALADEIKQQGEELLNGFYSNGVDALQLKPRADAQGTELPKSVTVNVDITLK